MYPNKIKNKIKLVGIEQQSGAASILTVFFISLGIAAAFYGASSLLKGYQENSLTTHSITQSQNLAWKTNGVVNDYLNQVYCETPNTAACVKNLTAIQNLSGVIPINGLNGVSAKVNKNTISSDGLITIDVQAKTGGSTVNIQSIHNLLANVNNDAYKIQYALLIGGDANIGSNISVNGENAGLDSGVAIRGKTTLTGPQNLKSITSTDSVSLSANNMINKITTNGDVTTNGSYSIGYLIAGGDFISDGNGQSQGSIGGESLVPENNQESNNLSQGERVSPFDVLIPNIDAYTLRNEANYRFELHNGNPSVYVKNIRNIVDGWYLIGGSSKDLDNKVVMENICKLNPATNCISYDNSNMTWTFKNLGINPGIVWLDGNLNITSPNGVKYINSIIATGSIQKLGNADVKAFNFATSIEACESLYSPTNYCVNNIQTNPSVGNIQFLAGGYNSTGSWTGGDITLTGNGANLGSIVAGNNLITNGNIDIGGALIVAGKGVNTLQTPLQLGGALNINLNPMNAVANSTDLPVSSVDGNYVQVKWVRYN